MRERIIHFFFPPRERSFLRRYGPIVLVIGVPVLILLIIPPVWEYSNTAQFCGTTCHTMPPEYNTYLVSPHARVPCVDCHIGRDWIAKQFVRKSEHLTLLYKTVVGDYEYPIRVGTMRPARDTCERCHFPEKFSDDSLRVINRFADDEENSQYDIYLLMHTGGGTEREGLGFGIHWHIENKIEYIATDPEQQNIPWVRVNRPNGDVEEYISLDSDIDTDNLGQYDIQEMDCITCHNRISHLVPNPRALIDTALYQGDISTDIPYIRAKAVEALSVVYESPEEAHANIGDLAGYYEDNYPDYYAENQAQVDTAIELLQDLYNDNTYSDQELNWTTHPNNIGHRDSAGCFRCHDGQHFNETQEAVRLECNLCHSVPQLVRPGTIEPMLPLTTGLEPSTHLDSSWISRHHIELNETCANCHTVENPGGTTDQSFCSNSGCHGVDWKYAGFDAPSLRVALGIVPQPTEWQPELVEGEPITFAVLQPFFEMECSQCHGDAPSKGLKVIEYDRLMAGSDDGPVVIPGEPDASLMIEVLENQHFVQLSEEQMGILRTWIAEGAIEGETLAPDEGEAGGEASAETTALSYESVLPAFEANCATCHGEAATKGLDVTTYETLMAGSEDGPVIEPGDVDASKIITILEAGHFGNFNDDELATLKAWIAAGAPETAEADEPEAATQGDTDAASAALSYDSIQPALETTCGGCHGEAATVGLNVTTYETLMAGGDDGPVIEPGDADASMIIQKLEEGHYAALSDEDMTALQAWIAAGAPETAETDEPEAATEGDTEAASAALSYDSIQPALETTCGGCHGEVATVGLNVTTYETLMAGGDDGPVIEPGDADASMIIQKLEEGHYAALSDEDLAALKAWIAAGAPEGTP